MDAAVLGRAVFALTTLVVALGLVPWRQSRAYESLARLDDLRRAVSVARAERTELSRRIQELESRGRVVPEAEERLGLHTPDATSELVILPGDARL